MHCSTISIVPLNVHLSNFIIIQVKNKTTSWVAMIVCLFLCLVWMRTEHLSGWGDHCRPILHPWLIAANANGWCLFAVKTYIYISILILLQGTCLNFTFRKDPHSVVLDISPERKGLRSQLGVWLSTPPSPPKVPVWSPCLCQGERRGWRSQGWGRGGWRSSPWPAGPHPWCRPRAAPSAQRACCREKYIMNTKLLLTRGCMQMTTFFHIFIKIMTPRAIQGREER